MRIAITGAAGMIGTALAEKAIADGHEVIAIVRPGSGRKEWIPRTAEIIECDISDYDRIQGKKKCDLFFHLAWSKTSAKDRDDAEQMKNVDRTLDAVELAKSWGASAFVGAGSQAEYGCLDAPADGNTPTHPESMYGIAKHAAGLAAKDLCEKSNIRYNWTRIFSVFGEHDADHTLIMYLIRTLIKGEVPELTECGQIWDYLYVKDAAQALLSIGMHGADGRTYVIGSGRCRPMKEYVTDVRDAIDPAIQVKFGAKEYYPHQQMFLCADIRELTADTGFVPEYSFKEGIERTVAFVRSSQQDPSQ